MSNLELITALVTCVLIGILAGIGSESFFLWVVVTEASFIFLIFLSDIYDKLNDIIKINKKILKEIKKIKK